MGNKITKAEVAAKEPKKSAFQRLFARFQMGPNKPDKLSGTKVKTEAKTAAPPKPPLRNHAERLQSQNEDPKDKSKTSEWTEVPLKVPDSPLGNNHAHEIKVTPVPPPRKHKIKIHEILDTPKRAKELQDQSPSLPVEEPIIVPKKVVEHVCDGTHHHVRNIVNGNVVDQIVTHEKELKQAKSSVKNASSLSLPSHNDLKKKDEKRASSPTKSSKKKTSAASLPTDKPKTTHSAAEKLESYMIRCKSFGSIIPHAKNEKPKHVELESDKESVDSWSGLDDWDLGIIEHDVSADLPHVPLKSKPTHKNGQAANKSQKKENEKGNYKLDTDGIDQLMASIDDEIDNKSPTLHSGKSEVKKVANNAEEEPIHHGSYPFKNTHVRSVFENDAFFAAQFLKHESNSNMYDTKKPLQTKLAPLAAFDSDKESENDAIIDSNLSKHINSEQSDIKRTIAFDINDEKPITSGAEKVAQDVKEKKNNVSSIENVPQVTPRRKSSTGHSNLLKFIKASNENVVFEKQPMSESTDNHDNNRKNVGNEKEQNEKIEEPKIVPELRNLNTSWHNILKRDDLNDIPLLEQESSISDLVETSSDDTRSTTVDTFNK